MPGISQVKYKRPSTKSMRDQANEFVGIKKKKKNKQANEFAGLGSGSKSKQKQANEFVGIKKKKPVRQANEFAGLGNKTKTKTKTKVIKPAAPTSFGQAFAQARKKLGAGKTFTYKGKKYSTNRADDKKTKVIKPAAPAKTKRVRGPKVSVPGSMRGGPPQRTGTKTKASMMGIDGASSTPKKNNAKTGLGSKTMSTKTKKTFKGTNITPTATQRKRMSRRMMGST